MKEIKLIGILKTFDKEELKSFRKFLYSPFIKSRRNIEALLINIIPFHPEFDSDKMESKIIFKKIFPGEVYDEKKLNNLIVDLTRAAKDFIIHLTIEEDETESLLFLLKGFYKRNLLKSNFTLLKSTEEKLIPGFSNSTQSDYFAKFRQINFLKTSYYADENEFEKLMDCESKYFDASATQFIVDCTQFKSARSASENTHGKKIGNKFTESVLKCFDMDKLIKLTENEDNLNSSLITLHYYRLKTNEHPEDVSHYYNLKNYFYKIMPGIGREEKHFTFSHLENYCVSKVEERNVNFIKEGLENFKSMLENGGYSFSENEYMQILTFRNIILFWIMSEDTEWIKFFIEKYSSVLNPDYRNDMINFAMANYFFKKKDYESALSCISGKFKHEFFLFKTDVKNLLLKIYYELGNIEQAYSLVDSYKHFLSSTKEITEIYLKRYEKFLKYYFHLLRVKSGQSKEKPAFILSKIEKEDKINNKKWLLEKAAELN